MQPTDLRDAEKNSLLSTLWNHSMVGVALVNKDGHFQRANPAFCAVVEYSEPELRSRRLHDLTHPADLESTVILTADIASGARERAVMKCRYLTKTGNVVWVLLSIERLEIDGEFQYFVNQLSEVLSVNQAQAPAPVEKKILFAPLMKGIRENLPVILLALGALAYIVAEAIKHL